jgi:hypothetical protein
MAHWTGRDEIQQLAKRIKELEDQLRAVQSAGTHLPFVDTDPNVSYGNLWMFNDNRLRIRKPDGTIREIVTTAPGSASSGSGLPAPTVQAQPHRGTYSAAWSQSYRGNGAARGDASLHFGYGTSSWGGLESSLIGWPYATIAADLAGATVTGVELYLYVEHCWWNSGATIGLASHNNTAQPGTLGGITTGFVSSINVKGADQGGTQGFHAISTAFGGWLRDGSSAGIALIPYSTDHQYYGYGWGVGSGFPVPQLRISYFK